MDNIHNILGLEEKKIPRGVLLDGPAATQALDSSGERLIIENMDISTLLEGKGTLNYEHEEKGKLPSTTVGKIVYAKKIIEEKDCTSPREKYWFDKVGKIPMLYIIGELFKNHTGANDVLAMLRFDTEAKERGEELPKTVCYSVEGGKLSKVKGTDIDSSLIKRVSITTSPCNHQAVAEELPLDQAVIQKSELFNIEILSKSEFNYTPFKPLKIKPLKKAMTAGGMNAAPSTLTQGSALQREGFAKVIKSKANEAFKLNKNRKKMINDLLAKHEGLTLQKATAIVKMASYKAMDKAEKKLKKLIKE